MLLANKLNSRAAIRILFWGLIRIVLQMLEEQFPHFVRFEQYDQCHQFCSFNDNWPVCLARLSILKIHLHSADYDEENEFHIPEQQHLHFVIIHRTLITCHSILRLRTIFYENLALVEPCEKINKEIYHISIVLYRCWDWLK